MQKENLTKAEIVDVMEKLCAGELLGAEAGAFLMGLTVKGETEEEIMALVEYLRSHMIPVSGVTHALDTCGTGGDGAQTINVSTMAAFVCAAAGVPVAKHGNRAVSSRCGSFDLLEKLGVNIHLSAEQAKQCFDKTGLAFLFAQNFQPAFKAIAPIRKSLGIRTVFNYLGPLLNPAGVEYQMIGVSSPVLAQKLGPILIKLGSKKVVFVHSADGLDEVSPAAPTQVFEYIENRDMKRYEIRPTEFYPLELVRGGGVEENTARTLTILSGQGTPAETAFLSLNAGLALYTAGEVSSFFEGKILAEKVIHSGFAKKKLDEVVTVTQSLS